LLPDPRVTATEAEWVAWNARLDETADLLNAIQTSVGYLREAGEDIRMLMNDHSDSSELEAAGTAALNAMEAWDHQITQPLHDTMEDEDAWETRLAGQVRFLLDVIEDSRPPLTGGALERLVDLKEQWAGLEAELAEIKTSHIAPINTWAKDHQIPHVSADMK